MRDDSWKPGGETERHCAFYKGGCTVYEFRPMVCRSFGTVTSVDEYCPRIRNAHGSIDYFAGKPVEATIKSYQELLKQYSEDKGENYNLVVYMPLGVLSFLLTDEELFELRDSTDDKFWSGVSGWFNYRVEFTRLHGYGIDRLGQEAVSSKIPLAFKVED
jgi:hypothetical protein